MKAKQFRAWSERVDLVAVKYAAIRFRFTADAAELTDEEIGIAIEALQKVQADRQTTVDPATDEALCDLMERDGVA